MLSPTESAASSEFENRASEPLPHGKGVFYYPQLDGLRSLAFLLVFGSHAGTFDAQTCFPILRLPAQIYSHIVGFGWCGVDLFFVLSSFLITSLLLREESAFGEIHVAAFLARRVLRIWPLYILAVVVGLLTFPIVDPAVINGGIRPGTPLFNSYVTSNLVWSLCFVLNLGISWKMVFPPAGLMPLWSISLEEQFYLTWSIILKVVRPLAARLVVLGLILVGSVTVRSYLMGTHPETHATYYVNTFSRLDPIVIGALIAFVFSFSSSIESIAKRFGVLFFVGALAILETTMVLNPRIFEEHNPFALTSFALGWGLFLVSVLTWRPASTVFKNVFLVKFGRLTYGMYVIHAMVLNLLFNQWVKPAGIAFPSNESACIALFIGLPLTYGIAFALWHGFEKHFYKLKDRLAYVRSGFVAAQEPALVPSALLRNAGRS
jgi:peptidoglycan/LPS O-acetylase OafA/YrhL